MTLGLLSLSGAVVLCHLAACQARRSEPDPLSCTPTSDSINGGPVAEQLDGEFRIRLVATDGPKARQSTVGTLRLQPYDSSLRQVTIGGIRDTASSYVLYGTADLDLEAIGAVRPGELDSTDPLRPGVLVIERKGTLTIRLGSEANRRDVARYDGGYTALRVAEGGPDRFAGRWSSGLASRRVSGYFCAAREAERTGKR